MDLRRYHWQRDELGNWTKMVICDLGGPDMERYMEERNYHIVDGPYICAVGSEGGHGYERKKENKIYTFKTLLDMDRGGNQSLLWKDCRGLMKLVHKDLLDLEMHRDGQEKPWVERDS
jgi:hypothetical protein